MDGQRFERDLEVTFRGAGLSAIRPRQDRPVDVGDLHVEDDIVVQAKAWKNLPAAIREGLTGSQAQARRAHRPFGVAIAKKASGAPLKDSIVAMPLSTFIALLQSRQTPGE